MGYMAREAGTGIQLEHLFGPQLRLGIVKSVLPEAEFIDTYVDLLSLDRDKTSVRSVVATPLGDLAVSNIMLWGNYARPSALSREAAREYVDDAIEQNEAIDRFQGRGVVGKSVQIIRYHMSMPSEFVPRSDRMTSLPDVIITDAYPSNIIDVFVRQSTEDSLSSAA